MEPIFTFGAQYYRPPTPDEADWAADLHNMKQSGMNSVRYWVLWRWVSRKEGEYYFDDLDTLMSLAEKEGLRVTLGFICDVMPSWVLRKYPESVMVMANGMRVEPQGFICRQIGGFPGPCLRHEGAKQARGAFIEAVTKRYKDSTALEAWDVWCEPEQDGLHRTPKMDTLTCYCDTCTRAFRRDLRKKYGTVDALNRVWGRCYADFDEAELPKTPDVFADFIDFCRFKLDTMSEEAAWRISTVKDADGAHPVYLHVVPNTGAIFNAVTCVDDFAMAKKCDLFGSTNFTNPIWSVATLSAASGKRCINAECHIGVGSIRNHQKIISYEDMLRDLVPQIGMGIRGFLFWQYHAERCGAESPGWGMTKPDGTKGSIQIAAERFIQALAPVHDEIMAASPARPEIAVWKGMNNEIFAFAAHGSLEAYSKDIEAYVNALYGRNTGVRIVGDEEVINGLDGVKLLIMPHCYAMDKKLADAVDEFVRNGGTLLCEAHFGGYDIGAGRHSKTMPGCGMAEKWGIRETLTTAVCYLKTDMSDGCLEGLSADERKAMEAYGAKGGNYFPMHGNGGFLLGASRFAEVEATDGETLFAFGKQSVVVKKKVGNGNIIYCGTNIGEGAAKEPERFADFLASVCRSAGILPNVTETPKGLHLDAVGESLVAVNNTSAEAKTLRLTGRWKSVFRENGDFENTVSIPPKSAELYRKMK